MSPERPWARRGPTSCRVILCHVKLCALPPQFARICAYTTLHMQSAPTSSLLLALLRLATTRPQCTVHRSVSSSVCRLCSHHAQRTRIKILNRTQQKRLVNAHGSWQWLFVDCRVKLLCGLTCGDAVPAQHITAVRFGGDARSGERSSSF